MHQLMTYEGILNAIGHRRSFSVSKGQPRTSTGSEESDLSDINQEDLRVKRLVQHIHQREKQYTKSRSSRSRRYVPYRSVY